MKMPAEKIIRRATLERGAVILATGKVRWPDGRANSYSVRIESAQGSDGDVSICVTDGNTDRTTRIRLSRNFKPTR